LIGFQRTKVMGAGRSDEGVVAVGLVHQPPSITKGRPPAVSTSPICFCFDRIAFHYRGLYRYSPLQLLWVQQSL
jgi:hypothetical protein